jgi:hypothetical protein
MLLSCNDTGEEEPATEPFALYFGQGRIIDESRCIVKPATTVWHLNAIGGLARWRADELPHGQEV